MLISAFQTLLWTYIAGCALDYARKPFLDICSVHGVKSSLLAFICPCAGVCCVPCWPAGLCVTLAMQVWTNMHLCG